MKDKIKTLIQNFRALEKKIAETPPSDTAQIKTLAKERKRLETIVLVAQEWLRLGDELDSLDEMIKSPDASLAALATAEKKELEPQFLEKNKILHKLMNPPDPRADRNTIIEIRAGAGGDEAGLFVADLFRMYTRFAQSKNLDVDIYTYNSTGLGGVKEVVFCVSGPNAYGWFRFEQGVHRVQRVPKTEAQGRIHTSTVTVAVLPEATDVEVKVDPKDLRIDTYRSSGAGGQHVNKTDSAIRITHIPSGVVVACQEERSQGQNRLRAMALLRTKLQEAAEEKLFKERHELRKKQVGTGDRSEKIRTYNFPQDRITDHRINFSVFNIEKFLSGEMDEMVKALQAKEEELLNAKEVV
jgi:peptide chain release factor 1